MNRRGLQTCLLCCLICLIAFPSSAQSVENVKATFQDGKVIVLYDLVGGNPAQKYSLELFGSHNNFSNPLRLVSGDAGKNVTPGQGKRIEWNAVGELGTYKGQITFRVRGTPAPPPFSFKSPAQGSTVRRGKTSTIEWAGGAPGQDVRLEIMQGDAVLQTLASTKNTGVHSWDVPKDLKNGEYSLRINGGSESAQSGIFKVKSKVPVILIASPIVAGALVFLLLPDKDGEGGTQDLPDAPSPK